MRRRLTPDLACLSGVTGSGSTSPEQIDEKAEGHHPHATPTGEEASRAAVLPGPLRKNQRESDRGPRIVFARRPVTEASPVNPSPSSSAVPGSGTTENGAEPGVGVASATKSDSGFRQAC